MSVPRTEWAVRVERDCRCVEIILQSGRFGKVAREELSSALLNPSTDVCIWLADRLYQQSVNMLAKARDEWLKEHMKTCDVRSLRDSRNFNKHCLH